MSLAVPQCAKATLDAARDGALVTRAEPWEHVSRVLARLGALVHFAGPVCHHALADIITAGGWTVSLTCIAVLDIGRRVFGIYTEVAAADPVLAFCMACVFKWKGLVSDLLRG